MELYEWNTQQLQSDVDVKRCYTWSGRIAFLSEASEAIGAGGSATL